MQLKQPVYNIDEVFVRFNELYGECSDFQKERYQFAFNEFKSKFSVDCAYVCSSSGRVEVCGNHTDHNGGKVLACAISLDTLCMFLPTSDNKVIIKSDKYEDVVVDLDNLDKDLPVSSASLVRGVAHGLRLRGFNCGGFIAYTTSRVSGGAGISSSAAFEVLIVEIFNFLYNNSVIDNQTKAYVSQYAENVFFKKPCGLLDQTAIAFGGLKELDFKNPDKINVKNVNNQIKDFSFVLINTGGSHENLTDEYASIPNEMKQVAKQFGVEKLIDVTISDFISLLPEKQANLSDRAIMRAIHFYEENLRVDSAVSALEKGDFSGFCNSINNSGISSMCNLQNCYVPTEEGRAIPKALAISKSFINNGASRVHGGGFAGCVLCVLKECEVNDFVSSMTAFYGVENVIPLKVRSVGTIVL